MILYADTSALAAVYLHDHDETARLAEVIYSPAHRIVTSELTDVEIASTLSRVEREGTISPRRASHLLSRYRADTSDAQGSIGVIPLAHTAIARAANYVRATPVRSLDAIHLASCSLFGEAVGEPVSLLSLDIRQRDAADALGIRRM